MNIVVLGAQWGDEGKGKIVDLMTPHFSLVARYRKIERDAANAVRKDLAALRTDIGRARKSGSR